MQVCGRHEHYVAGEEVSAREDDHDKADGEHKRPTVWIRPGAFSWYQGAVSVERKTAQLGGVSRSSNGEAGDARESEKGIGHHGVEEELVEALMCFLRAYPADQFNGLLRREGVHLGDLL
jgi:hypothetical protein